MITSIIVNYNRGLNIPEIVEAIRNQSVKSEVWIWDNSGDAPAAGDVNVKSSRNFAQLGRWMLLQSVQTPYVWLNDDDGRINTPYLFKNLLAESEKYPHSILGWKGKKFDGVDVDPRRPYQEKGGWVGYPAETDMINMGFSFFKRDLINSIISNPFHELTEDEHQHADEIYISNRVKTRVSEFIYDGVTMISERGRKLSGETHHMQIRNKLCRRYWLD
jgi:hypothetical protein